MIIFRPDTLSFCVNINIEYYIIKHISVVMKMFLLKLISNKYYETNEKSNKNNITFIILKKAYIYSGNL